MREMSHELPPESKRFPTGPTVEFRAFLVFFNARLLVFFEWTLRQGEIREVSLAGLSFPFSTSVESFP